MGNEEIKVQMTKTWGINRLRGQDQRMTVVESGFSSCSFPPRLYSDRRPASGRVNGGACLEQLVWREIPATLLTKRHCGCLGLTSTHSLRASRVFGLWCSLTTKPFHMLAKLSTYTGYLRVRVTEFPRGLHQSRKAIHNIRFNLGLKFNLGYLRLCSPNSEFSNQSLRVLTGH